MTTDVLPRHAVQALVETGNMEDEGQLKSTLVRVVRTYIFPKMKFALDHDFLVDGVLYKKIRKKMTQRGSGSGSSAVAFKRFWQSVGWKVVRSTINNKRNNVQDSVRKYAIKCE